MCVNLEVFRKGLLHGTLLWYIIQITGLLLPRSSYHEALKLIFKRHQVGNSFVNNME